MSDCVKIFALVIVLQQFGAAQQTNPGTTQNSATGQAQETPVDGAVDNRDDREPPLSPEEERQKQIRMFDPLKSQETDDPKTDQAKPGGDAKDPGSQQTIPGTVPVPGSIASINRANAAGQNRGPQVVQDGGAVGPDAGFTGPAVLSRSYTVNRPLNIQDVKWQETFGLTANLTSGAAVSGYTPGGAASGGANLYGVAMSFGLSGRKVWRHDQLAVHLSSQYQTNYPANGIYNGPNNNLSVDYMREFSRRLSFTLRETATVYSQNYTLQNPTPGPDTTIAEINLGSSPNIQIYDTGTKQFNSQIDATWQKSERLSFNFGASYFVIERNSPLLIGTGGEQARSDVTYRWSKRTTVGLYYQNSEYKYQHGAGTSGINTLGLIYSYAFSRTLQFRFRGGGSVVESLGLEAVKIDPAIAALLGRSSGVIDAYRRSGTSDVSAQLIKDFRDGSTASIAYARGISPGNGVYQASTQESVGASLTTTLRRVYMLRLSVARDTLSSFTQTLGSLTSDTVSFSVSRSLRNGFSLNFLASYRRVATSTISSLNNQTLVSSGVSWSPPAGRLWPF